MTGNVRFNALPSEVQRTSAKDAAPLKRQSSKIFSRSISKIDLKENTPSKTAEKTDHTYGEIAKPPSSGSEESLTRSVSFSNRSESDTTENIDGIAKEMINNHISTPSLHLETFKSLFGVKGTDGNIHNLNEIKIIYLRMCEFANASGASPDIMIEQLKQGVKVANEIASPDFKDNKKEYSANDLAALDWFIRAQHAKMRKLYLKGATKIPDPDHHLAQFILQVRGKNHGNETREKGPYPRESSHQPENRSQIRSTTIHCANGEKICFSSDNKKALLREGIHEENIHFYDQVALGIDVSGKGLTPPGKESGTYLFMLLKEGTTPVVYLKAESNSAAPIEGKYGNKSELAKEKFEHGLHIYKKFVPVNEGGAFPDLKEDKLPSNILNHLKKIDILKGEKNTPLRQSYDNLQKTTEFSNNYALPQLKAHLENQLKPDVKIEKDQEDKIKSLLTEIETVLDQGKTNSEFPIIPRSREVILPSLQEMLDNKTVFSP